METNEPTADAIEAEKPEEAKTPAAGGEIQREAVSRDVIRGRIDYSKDQLTKAFRYHLFQSMKRFFIIDIVLEIVLAALLAWMIALGMGDDEGLLLTVIITLLVALPAISVVFAFVLPSVMAKGNKDLFGATEILTFSEEGFSVSTNGPAYNGHVDVKYPFVFKVIETNDSFYIYLSAVKLIPLLKANIDNNRAYDLGRLLHGKLTPGKFVYKVK